MITAATESNESGTALKLHEHKYTPFEQLLYDLQNKKILCSLKDYPGVSLDHLNEYLEEHGPLFNIQFGNLVEFYTDERGEEKDLLLPCRMVVYGREKVVWYIGVQLGNWIAWNPKIGGSGTTSQGAYILYKDDDDSNERPVLGNSRNVRIPDLAYLPREIDRSLDAKQMWTYQGDPFVPTFVLEVDTLAGPNSEFKHLDYKMREEYFKHGVQLGWLIDPYNKIMIEYKRTNERTRSGGVYASQDRSWRDLDGGDVLPGFVVETVELDRVLDQEPGSSSEEEPEVPLICPACGHVSASWSENVAHAESHRKKKANEKYLRNKK